MPKAKTESTSCEALRLRVAVLASGQGSNLQALFDAIEGGRCHARVMGVVSDRRTAAALRLATERELVTRVVRPRDYPDRATWDVALCSTAEALEPDLIVLAGFMRILGAPILARFRHRIINVHPALLPSFPGNDAPAQAIDAGVRISGCTVHVVDEGVDTGPVLAQAAVPVLCGDDPKSLHDRIQGLEHRLLPAVVDWIAKGRIELREKPQVPVGDVGAGFLVVPALPGTP